MWDSATLRWMRHCRSSTSLYEFLSCLVDHLFYTDARYRWRTLPGIVVANVPPHRTLLWPLLGPWGLQQGIFYTFRALIASARRWRISSPRKRAIVTSPSNRVSSAQFAQRSNDELFKRLLNSKQTTNVVSMLKESVLQSVAALPKASWLRGQTRLDWRQFLAIPVIILMFLFIAWSGSGGASIILKQSPGRTKCVRIQHAGSCRNSPCVSGHLPEKHAGYRC